MEGIKREYRMSKEGILQFYKTRQSAAIPSFEILRFDIRYSAVCCLPNFWLPMHTILLLKQL